MASLFTWDDLSPHRVLSLRSAKADDPAMYAAPSAATNQEGQPAPTTGAAAPESDTNKNSADKRSDAAAKPEGDKKSDDKSPQDAKDKSKDKKANDVEPVKRPEKPAHAPDPTELKVRPDQEGMVSFSFKGQPWQAVLEWVADISHMSLDWQEVPGGYLDLATRRKYKVDEARDLINSILLTKGFTLLRNGEVLIVASLKNLDVSLVPVVLPSELGSRGTFELVRTFFDLDRLQAETMAEELKPLLSPYGKINALKTTNRLDVLETAGNLRRIREVIGVEQGESGKEHQLREFPLHNARADDVLASLKQLLGIPPEKNPSAGPTGPDQMQQQAQQMQQMMQQMQQQAQQGTPGGDKKAHPQQQEEKIYLTINRRENSIMALATPDKLAVIEQAVQLLDVPTTASSPLAGVQRVQIYRLVAADPAPIVSVLKDMGNLDPSTRLEVDSVNKAVIVSGPLVDHVTVRALIDKLDGSARQFEVIQLRKLDADYVAGSIDFLMRGPNKDNNSNRPRFFWDNGGNRQTDPNKDGGFQVEADTKNNRLLLRANQIEMEEIRALMVKLGEDPFLNAQHDNLHIIRSSSGRDTDALLEKLKRIWPNVSATPLDINADHSQQPAVDNSSTESQEKKGRNSTDKSDKSNDGAAPEKSEKKQESQKQSASAATATAAVQLPHRVDRSLADAYLVADSDSANSSSENSDGETSEITRPQRTGSDHNGITPTSTTTIDSQGSPANNPPPISITRSPQGLIVTSRDQAALDEFLKLIDELSPAESHFHTFNLKHADAKDVAVLLESVFQDVGAKKDNTNSRVFYIFDEPPAENKERNRLSKREPLRFIADPITNSILVRGADDELLPQIQALIEFYDRATPPDSPLIRHTQIVVIKYAKAQAVSEVLKDVYRDLLSPNDRALASMQQQQQQKPQPLFSYFDADSSSGSKTPADGLKFKGLLSVGVDVTSNTLIISCPQFLMPGVLDMVHKLDDSTKPVEPIVRVINMKGAFDDPLIKAALKNVADPDAAKRAAASNPADSKREDQNHNRWNNGRNGPSGGINNGMNDNGNNGQNSPR